MAIRGGVFLWGAERGILPVTAPEGPGDRARVITSVSNPRRQPTKLAGFISRRQEAFLTRRAR
jgi:hypothetical protein